MVKYRYRIRSGNYVLKSRAEKRVEKLKKAGFSAFIYQTEKSIRYKVQVGMFDSKANAKDYQRILKDRGFNSKIIRIKVMAFQPRLTRSGMEGLPYWQSQNPYTARGNGLPNCTCYAYGRWWEILGSPVSDLGNLGNAGNWYTNVSNNISKGYSPHLGGIMCWHRPGSAEGIGHVAVVEQILEDGNIITSNSGYTRDPDEMEQRYFWTEEVFQQAGYRSNWEVNYGYTYQGCLYLPSDPVNHEWISDNRYLNEYEMQQNAALAYNYLFSCGYDELSIAAILGNMQQESGINPGIWENLSINPSRGYGLVQWTPSTYYTDWANNHGYSISDGYPQLLWIDTELDAGGYWVQRNGYNITYDNFKNNSDENDIYYLTAAWYYNFENPGSGDTTLRARQEYAKYWYNFFQGYAPANPPNPWSPLPQNSRKMSWWMWLGWRNKYGY